MRISGWSSDVCSSDLCLMDSLSMILLVIPFLWPVLVEINGGLYMTAEGAGFAMSTEDLKIWFGILSLIVVELGLITPPVGMNVFVISALADDIPMSRSEEHTSELQSLMRISYAVFCLKKKTDNTIIK